MNALPEGDALHLAQLVRSGEVSASELLEAAISAVERLNPQLNAVIGSLYDDARSRTQLPLGNGPFAGVPFLIKDLLSDYAGHPISSGSRFLKDYVPEQDSEMVVRYKRSGLNIFGKTNTPEFGLTPFTEPQLFGPTRNPWDLDRTPGGSSGGTGAAVAAGLVPMAGGGDGGGSIRIPAAYNGLFGLKPSRGRISVGPYAGEAWTGASTDHVVSRTVRDSAAMLDVLSGPASGDPFTIPEPSAPWADLMQQSPGRLKIGVFTSSPYDTEVAPECVAAVEETARLLESLGHNVEYARPEFDGLALARCYLALYFGEVSALMERAKTEFGAIDRDFELETRLLGMLGRTMPLPDYVRLRQQWNDFARALGAYFDRFDLYLCPTTGQLPARIGQMDTPAHLKLVARLMLGLKAGKLVHKSGQVDQMALESLARTPFTQLANLTGTPAMSVPLYWTRDGLPVGVQFGAGHGGEDRLLQVAAQLEEANPWFSNYERLEDAF